MVIHVSEDLQFEVEDQGETKTVCFVGDRIHLGEQHVSVLGKSLTDLVSDSQRPNLLLDLRNVVFLPSAMLGLLIRLDRQWRASGGRLILTELGPLVLQVFKECRLDEILVVRPSRV